MATSSCTLTSRLTRFSSSLLHFLTRSLRQPDNLFLCDEVGIKIGDFGLCIREDEWEDQEGDRRYLAPEILNSQATCKSDVFSAGLIIFQVTYRPRPLHSLLSSLAPTHDRSQMLKNLKDLPGNGNDWHLLR